MEKGVRNISINKKYLFASIALGLLLCIAQIAANAMLITGCLLLYMLLLAVGCIYDFTLPILLFFLPWSPIMRMNPDGFSVYTFGLVMACLFSVIKKRFSLRKYQLIAGLILIILTLLSKLLEGNELSFAYIAFMMMIVLFPSVLEESRKQKYDFYHLVMFFSLGAIVASLCAMSFAESANIQQFIRVDTYQTIVRRSGFYGDANFYAAQILAALGGALALTLQERMRKKLIYLAITALFLLYCGFLSGSKSFALVTALMLLFWIVAVWKMRGSAGLKILLLTCFAGAVIYIATSAMFSELISIIEERFSRTTDVDSFTTGRVGLWKSYTDEIFGNPKVFFLGEGFTNIKVNDRGSHNTIIQLFYQFGILGAPVVFYWIINYFRSNIQEYRNEKSLRLHRLIIYVGAFVPWLAIDMLFFDEFFLLPWFVMAALEQFGKQPEPEEQSLNST